MSYGNEAVFYSNLYYTVDVTANYQNDTVFSDGSERAVARDNSSFWYAGVRYGAYYKTDAELAVLDVSTSSTAEAALTAAYWFECGSAHEEAESTTTGASCPAATSSTSNSSSSSARARARSF